MGARAGLDGRKISSQPDSIPDRPARTQSLYRLSYLAHVSDKKKTPGDKTETRTVSKFPASPENRAVYEITLQNTAAERDSSMMMISVEKRSSEGKIYLM